MQLLADIAQLCLIHAAYVYSGVFLYGVDHGDAFERSLEVDGVVADFDFCSAVYVHTDLLDHAFGEVHHPVVILV